MLEYYGGQLVVVATVPIQILSVLCAMFYDVFQQSIVYGHNY